MNTIRRRRTQLNDVTLSRRRFIQGLAAGSVVAGIAPAIATTIERDAQTNTGSPAVLTGTEFDLVIAQTLVNFTGASRLATTINGSIPGPTLRWKEGDTVTLRVTNKLPESTSIHWHGIILPFQMDGVPGISYPGIAPGTTFTYRFKIQQSGTYWYHSHSGFQEQLGMYGAIIIDPAKGNRHKVDQDYTVHLGDWTDEDPMRVFAKLKKQSDYYNYNQPTAGDFFRDVATDGLSSAIRKRTMWNQMRMSPTDLGDITGHTYTYLMNGVTPAGNWTGLFKRGEKIRLRFINGGSGTLFDVRVPGLKMTVIQTDGVDVEPVTVDEFRFGPGETYDVLVTPTEDAHTIFAQSMDRTGFASGTIASQSGLRAAVPALDAPQWLTMTDMMGAMDHNAHGSHDMSNHGSATKVRHASTESGASVDMRVDQPRTNLDDPGIGLRNNGRRVLTYADLKTIGGSNIRRTPDRELEFHLTGNMERYTWSIDGLTFGESTPIHFKHGEVVRVILHNDTMMTHPMHLHGMWSELQTADGKFQARKHTINVQPAQRISFLVHADALGRWAWHCHLMYHMDAGMFREIVVA